MKILKYWRVSLNTVLVYVTPNKWLQHWQLCWAACWGFHDVMCLLKLTAALKLNNRETRTESEDQSADVFKQIKSQTLFFDDCPSHPNSCNEGITAPWGWRAENTPWSYSRCVSATRGSILHFTTSFVQKFFKLYVSGLQEKNETKGLHSETSSHLQL